MVASTTAIVSHPPAACAVRRFVHAHAARLLSMLPQATTLPATLQWGHAHSPSVDGGCGSLANKSTLLGSSFTTCAHAQGSLLLRTGARLHSYG